MNRTTAVLTVLLTLLILLSSAVANAEEYPTPSELEKLAAKAAKDAGGSSQTLAKTSGGHEIQLATVGAKAGTAPAILIVANMEGDTPPASLAALRLLERLGGVDKRLTENLTWYIVPVGNPDGYEHYFTSPRSENHFNSRPVNDDYDDLIDEDGPEDLNGDGFITMIRQPHPDGQWIEANGGPLMRKADASRGEVGRWRLLPEGIDNDGDGEINEDAPGGVNPGINFPHEFEHYKPHGGLYAASEVESRAILAFAYDHPEIEMLLSFGRVNTLSAPPPTDRKSAAAEDEYEVPERWADAIGLQPNKKYPLDLIVERVRSAFGNPDISEDRVLRWLGAGAAVNPDRNDLAWWKAVAEKYSTTMKLAGESDKLLSAPRQIAGSVEEWGYYQFGVPSFGLDFWTPEKADDPEPETGVLTSDSLASMESEALLARSDGELSELVSALGGGLTLESLKNGVESGLITVKTLADLLKSAEKEASKGADEKQRAYYAYDSASFVPWTPYRHPELGDVEIGGFIPWSETTPKLEDAEAVIARRLAFLPQLTSLLPSLRFGEVEVTRVEQGVYRIEVWAVNEGFLPYPTHQGQRSSRPIPAVVTVEGKDLLFLEGRSRSVLRLLEGSGGSESVSLLVSGKEGAKVTLSLKTALPCDELTVTLTEGGGR